MNPAQLATRIEKLTALLDVGKAMASERNLDRLLQLILGEVTRVMEADRSSLFLVDRERNELWSKIAQGLEVREIRIKIGMGISGYVAQTGKTVNIPDAYADPRFNQETDRRTGYRTRNILCAPMRNKHEEVIGVLQVLNKLDGAFTAEDEDLLLALSSQAAVAVENAILYEDIQKLFEGFIKASVYAIESRDPTTSGHSERVAILTIGLAENVDRSDVGPVRRRELLRRGHARAPLRLAPPRLRQGRRPRAGAGEGEQALRAGPGDRQGPLQVRQEGRGERIPPAEALAGPDAGSQGRGRTGGPGRRDGSASWPRWTISLPSSWRRTSPPSSPRGASSGSWRSRPTRIADVDGSFQPYLFTKEAENLSIAKGSLNLQERLEIESHVTHSFRFLRQIPWTKDLRRVPTIAYAHHEKLNGTGYPNSLRTDDIPLQAKMMAICDIYDALTAADRPYKRALPPEKALDILGFEVKDGHLDAELVRIFTESNTWKLSLPLRPGGK